MGVKPDLSHYGRKELRVLGNRMPIRIFGPDIRLKKTA
jgi:hypothetical protein